MRPRNGLFLSDSLGLTGDCYDRYLDDRNEYLSDILSRDVATLDWHDKESLTTLLIEICCGRHPALWDIWRQKHALPACTVFPPGPLVDEITSLMMAMPEDQFYMTEEAKDMLNIVFYTGDVDAGNAILSLFITRSPSFSAYLGRNFSWERVGMSPPVHFLGKNGSGARELIERCGADPDCVMYYTMTAIPEIAYWEEVIRNGVDDKVLNSVLLFSSAYHPIEHVEYLLSRGASVNFRSRFPDWEWQRKGWTALAHAADKGKTEMVMFLLKNGADVLQEFVGRVGGKGTISQLVSQDPRRQELARVLAQAECEERVRRGTAHGLSLLISQPLSDGVC